MKSGPWISVLSIAAILSVGCGSSSDAPTAEDKTFQDQIAQAAAKNKGKAEPKNHLKKPPSDLASKAAPATDGGEPAKP